MDLESVFNGPLTTGEKQGKTGASVWEAEVALRLSKEEGHEGVDQMKACIESPYDNVPKPCIGGRPVIAWVKTAYCY